MLCAEGPNAARLPKVAASILGVRRRLIAAVKKSRRSLKWVAASFRMGLAR